MGVREEIFPSEQKEAYVQTQWARGWAYGVIGFGYAARMLTEQRASMHANVDQIGLAVFYLQRHRVELVIKQALVSLGSEATEVAKLGHNLSRLWKRLESVVRANGDDHWQVLQLPLSHRQERRRVETGDFIDLDALERHAESFESGVQGYTDWVQEMEYARGEYD